MEHNWWHFDDYVPYMFSLLFHLFSYYNKASILKVTLQQVLELIAITKDHFSMELTSVNHWYQFSNQGNVEAPQ